MTHPGSRRQNRRGLQGVSALVLLLGGQGCPTPPAVVNDGGRPDAGDAEPPTDAGAGDGGDRAPPLMWTEAAPLPDAVANNAVAAVDAGGECHLFSFMGIGSDLQDDDIRRAALHRRAADATWNSIGDVPGDVGRLAASAVALRGRAVLIGGYSVAGSGAETSSARVDAYSALTGEWTALADIPIAIDDTVAVTWRDRWIVVVSGWSNTDNVDAVQVYDADTDTWAAGTPFPGEPVFGHAGGLSGDTMVIVDGAGGIAAGFSLIEQAWQATLDPDDPTSIAWLDVGPHPGPGRYRAAAGFDFAGGVLISGGTSMPYNFDGLAYAGGQPATPLADAIRWTPAAGFESLASSHPAPTMDHRGLVGCPGTPLFTFGGLQAGPVVTPQGFALSRP